MSGFRIGRKFAQHSYPDPRRSTTVAFARNSATGPAADQGFDDTGAQVVWDSIESGAVAGVNVPITPLSSGKIHITGVITVKTDNPNSVDVNLTVEVDSLLVPRPANEMVSVSGTGPDMPWAAIPFDVIVNLPVGVTSNIEILMTASADVAIHIEAGSSSISIQEVPPVTG
jgi:hypothetical protein